MKLRDYLINPFQDDHDFIYIDKFENLFHYLHNDRDVIFYPNRKKPSIEKSDYLSQNHTLMTKAEILSIFEEFKSTKSTLLMLNPDVDMPMIKDYYRLITLDHLPFDQNLQSNLELLTLEDFLDSDFINRIPDNMQIFCHSVIHDNKKLHMIPLGRDPKSRHIASHKYRLEKIRLCHYSCTLPPLSLHWYGRIRKYIFDGLKHSEFISCDDTLSKQSISYYIKDITKYSDFFNTLASTKFVICPRGCGLDTYRMWDSLYLGCVPIVVKFSGYEKLSGLPILWVDKWQDYLSLSEDYLNSIWNTMLDTDFNYDMLRFEYWKNKIINNIEK